MKQISGKKLAKLLEKHGWKLVRINGSHHTYKNPDFRNMITIPIHGSKPVKQGIIKQILKNAKISEEEL